MSLRSVFYNAASIILGRRRATPGLWLANPAASEDLPVLTTGFRPLDKATGIKGLPRGRITELIGPDPKGVVSIAAGVAARLQRRQQPVTIIDMAGNFEPAHAMRCGLAAPELLRVIPVNAFELINAMELAARQAGLIIVNLGFTPQTLNGAEPALLTSLLHRLRRIAFGSESVFLYLTTPEEADPFIHTNYPGGFPLNDMADLRLWVQNEGWIKRKQVISGYKGSVTVIKNRFALGGKGANLRIPFADPAAARLSEELGF